jgi:hypothetical protein
MEIQVKIAKILEPQSFVSKKDGLTYVKHHFVGTTSGQYPKQIAFSVMGDDKFKEMGLVVGGEYTVYFDVYSREWNGKWFTDVSCWRCVPIGVVNQQQTQNITPQVTQNKQVTQVNSSNTLNNNAETEEDLPF